MPQLERQRLLRADVHSHSAGYDYPGQELLVTFDIWDTRKHSKESDERKYTVTVTRREILLLVAAGTNLIC